MIINGKKYLVTLLAALLMAVCVLNVKSDPYTDALAYVELLENELARLRREIPVLKKDLKRDRRLLLSYEKIRDKSLKTIEDNADAREANDARLRKINELIPPLTKAINLNQATIDWVNAWFRDNDEAYKPSTARKLREDKTAAIAARDRDQATKDALEAERRVLRNDNRRLKRSTDAAKTSVEFCQERIDYLQPKVGTLAEELRIKVAQEAALPQAIINAKASADATQQRLNERPNFDAGGPDDDQGGDNDDQGGDNDNQGGPNTDDDDDSPNDDEGGENFDMPDGSPNTDDDDGDG
jgi:chromosome segregation ATPase